MRQLKDAMREAKKRLESKDEAARKEYQEKLIKARIVIHETNFLYDIIVEHTTGIGDNTYKLRVKDLLKVYDVDPKMLVEQINISGSEMKAEFYYGPSYLHAHQVILRWNTKSFDK